MYQFSSATLIILLLGKGVCIKHPFSTIWRIPSITHIRKKRFQTPTTGRWWELRLKGNILKRKYLLFIVSCLVIKDLFAYDYLNYASAFKPADYTEAMRMAVKFFGGQRCGNTHNWMLYDHEGLAVKVCHTKDAYQGKDVSGGWHDCGDHIKVAVTMGYSALCLLCAYDIWPQAFRDMYDAEYGPPNSIPDVLDEAKIATDFFIKSFPDENTFVYYAGNGDYDHKRWSPSSVQSGFPVPEGGDPRPTTASSTTGGAQAAAYGAALCLMAIHYPDAAYRDLCRQNAIKLYAYAKSHPGNISIPSFYPSPNTETSDEMGLCAVMLYRLTGNEQYKNEAVQYIAGKWESNYPLAWDTVADLLYYYLITFVDKNISNGSGGSIANFITKNVFNLAVPAGNPHAEGYPFFQNRWGTNKLACGSAFAAALYNELAKKGLVTNTDNNKKISKNFNRRIIDYMLGENEFDHPFIHGYKGDMTHRIHHRNAFGSTVEHTTTEQKNTLPFKFASGGLIGGPSDYKSFKNLVEGGDAFMETEGGCDYNGPLIGALANIVAELDPISAIKQHARARTIQYRLCRTNSGNLQLTLSLACPGMLQIHLTDLRGKTIQKVPARYYRQGAYAIEVITGLRQAGCGMYLVSVGFNGQWSALRTMIIN